MKKVDVVFVVLTYKNVKILYSFIDSLKHIKNCTYKVIIVNSFFDDDSKRKFQEIASEFKFDFLNIENKGYGYGNNAGLQFAYNEYSFKHIIISNPDVKIDFFDYNDFSNISDNIIAPKVISEKGKNMNPLLPYHRFLNEWLIYKGFKSHKNTFVMIGIFLNKINKWTFHHFHKHKNIFACHGCFFIIPFEILSSKGFLPLFDDNIFLNCEESDIAMKCKTMGIKTVYNSNVIITHFGQQSKNEEKEGLSMENLRNSFIYYYEKWSCK